MSVFRFDFICVGGFSDLLWSMIDWMDKGVGSIGTLLTKTLSKNPESGIGCIPNYFDLFIIVIRNIQNVLFSLTMSL